MDESAAARQWSVARDLLDRALALPAPERTRFLDHQCTSPTLRAELESLLEAAGRSAFFDQPAGLTASLAHTLAAPAADLTGQTLSHYRITGLIGSGGMGTVYRAVDENLNRAVALKVISGFGPSPQERLRFEREAKAASALNHPNIVTVYEIDRHQEIDFLVMERVNGQTLQQWADGRAMPLAEVLPLAIQIADALAAAHEAGIVHRDLKPANVMVTDRGVVKILDFGLAKQLLAAEVAEPTETVRDGNPELSRAGQIQGTLYYMSPEQSTGESVDARSDIFAFGVVLYELLTGQRAFQRETARATLAAISTEEPEPLRSLRPDLPPLVDTIIGRCLRKPPGERWQSLTEVKGMLLDLASEGDVPEPAPPRRPWWLATAAAAAVLALAVLAWPRATPPAVEAPRKAPGVQNALWVDLSGDWRIHLQDRPEHASPDFDDQAWKTQTLPRGSLYLFGTKYWLRRRVDLPAGTDRTQLALTLGVLHDVYEVYINGRLIGGTGSLDSFEHALIPRPRTFDISPEAAQGPLLVALRVRGALLSHVSWRLHDVGPYLLTYRDQAPRTEGRRQLESQWFAIAPDVVFGAVMGVMGLLILFAWRTERTRRELYWLTILCFASAFTVSYVTTQLLVDSPPFNRAGVYWSSLLSTLNVVIGVEFILAALQVQSRTLRLVIWSAWGMSLLALFSSRSGQAFVSGAMFVVGGTVLMTLLRNWYGLIGHRVPLHEHGLRLVFVLRIIPGWIFLFSLLGEARQKTAESIVTLHLTHFPAFGLGPVRVKYEHIFTLLYVAIILALLFRRFAAEREQRQRLTRRAKVVETLLAR